MKPLLLLLLLVLGACTGDERPPASPADPASPHAAEAKFDLGPDPLAAPDGGAR